MAKATAICACNKCNGEFEKVTIKRNRREADSWEEWARNTFNICPECEEKEHIERMNKVAKEARENGLPELTGSEKQIRWALSIRKDFIEKVEQTMRRRKDDTKALYKDALSAMVSNESSKNWIESRDSLNYIFNCIVDATSKNIEINEDVISFDCYDKAFVRGIKIA